MLKIKGESRVLSISPVLQVTEKFQKRELVLDDSWVREGEVHENPIMIEFSGDKMTQLDNIMPGQQVTVEAYVKGRFYKGKYYHSNIGMTVAPCQPQAVQCVPPQQVAQSPAYAPPVYQQLQYPSQPQYPQQPAQAPYPAQSTAPAYQQPATQPVAQPAYSPAYQPTQQPYQQAQPPQQPNHTPGKADLPFPT